MKSGFQVPIIDSSHYVLGDGNVPQAILQEDGNWKDFLPSPELQNIRGIETYGCTAFGTTNAIETLMFRLFGEKVNYSDRFLGICAGTKEGGNDPQAVAEAIRKNGLIPEEMLPFSNDIQSIEDYYSFKGGDEQACRDEGQRWLKKYKFLHEWVFSQSQPREEKINNAKIALKSSPLNISVYAWDEENGVYVGSAPNHWTTQYAFDEKDLMQIFDSYDPFDKLVDQNVLFCKRYHIELNPTKVSFIHKLFPCLQT